MITLVVETKESVCTKGEDRGLYFQIEGNMSSFSSSCLFPIPQNRFVVVGQGQHFRYCENATITEVKGFVFSVVSKVRKNQEGCVFLSKTKLHQLYLNKGCVA